MTGFCLTTTLIGALLALGMSRTPAWTFDGAGRAVGLLQRASELADLSQAPRPAEVPLSSAGGLPRDQNRS